METFIDKGFWRNVCERERERETDRQTDKQEAEIDTETNGGRKRTFYCGLRSRLCF